jgi:hypothetical protein
MSNIVKGAFGGRIIPSEPDSNNINEQMIELKNM